MLLQQKKYGTSFCTCTFVMSFSNSSSLLAGRKTSGGVFVTRCCDSSKMSTFRDTTCSSVCTDLMAVYMTCHNLGFIGAFLQISVV